MTPSARYRQLAYLALGLTFALVIVGGVVRVSDSGLGCGPGGSGTDGWPLCSGRLIPLIDTNMIVEYSHRILASALALTIGVLAFLARRRYRENRPLVKVTAAAFGLVLFQAALGGLTVEKGLEEELVAAHLGVAMLQIGLLMLVAYLARPAAQARRDGRRSSPGASPQLVRVLAVACSVAVLGTIVAGGYMSASELHGTDRTSPGVHTACGTDFPSCGGEFLPFGHSRELDIHLTHRAFMYVAATLIVVLLAAVLWDRRRRNGVADPALARAAGVTTLVLAVQILLGALNVWIGKEGWLIVAHLAVGTLLWCSLLLVTLIAVRAPRRAHADAPREADIQAVPA